MIVGRYRSPLTLLALKMRLVPFLVAWKYWLAGFGIGVAVGFISAVLILTNI